MGQEKNIYAFCNQKGGVGKTTTVINFGTGLSQLGFKVLIIDLDPQGNATSGFGIEKNHVESTIYDVLSEDMDMREVIISDVVPRVDLIAANAHLAGAEIELIGLERREYYLRERVRKQADAYDFIFIDCPPSLGLLTLNALVASDRMIIPLQCEYYALEGLGQLLDTYNLIKNRLNNELELHGVVMTMADFRTNLTEQVISEVNEFFKEKVFTTIIPRSVKLSEAPGFGKPAVLYAPSSRGVYQYQLLVEEFLDRQSIPYNYQFAEDGDESQTYPHEQRMRNDDGNKEKTEIEEEHV